MSEKISQVLVFFQEYKQVFANVLEDEKDKLKKFLTFDLDQINEAIKKQQSNEMRIANIEKKRIKLQQALGLENMTFKEIISSLDNPKELEVLYKEIEVLVNDVKFYNNKAMEIAKSQLSLYGAIKENDVANDMEDKKSDTVLGKI